MSVLVTGSFDLLHPGHIAFLKEATAYGKVYVGIGSDVSIKQLKGRETIFNEKERLFMVNAIRYVEFAWVNHGMGKFDFFDDIFKHNIYIDKLVVNEDQDFPEKREFCKKHNLKYIVLKRIPEKGLPVRSSTSLRQYYD